MTDTRLVNSQGKLIKEWFDKSGPISFAKAQTIAASLGFGMIPKVINNRLAAVPARYNFSDWIGVWVMTATGLTALSYGGTQALKYWFLFYGAGNTVGSILYTVG